MRTWRAEHGSGLRLRLTVCCPPTDTRLTWKVTPWARAPPPPSPCRSPRPRACPAARLVCDWTGTAFSYSTSMAAVARRRVPVPRLREPGWAWPQLGLPVACCGWVPGALPGAHPAGPAPPPREQDTRGWVDTREPPATVRSALGQRGTAHTAAPSPSAPVHRGVASLAAGALGENTCATPVSPLFGSGSGRVSSQVCVYVSRRSVQPQL